MWQKVVYIGKVWALVGVAFVMVTILMPFFSTHAGNAAGNVTASPNAAQYVGAAEAANYAPLFVYLIPAVAGVGFTIWKLKQS